MELKVKKSMLEENWMEEQYCWFRDQMHQVKMKKIQAESNMKMAPLMALVCVILISLYTKNVVLENTKIAYLCASLCVGVIVATIMYVFIQRNRLKDVYWKEVCLEYSVPEVEKLRNLIAGFQNNVIQAVEEKKPAVVCCGRYLESRDQIVAFMEYEFKIPKERSQMWSDKEILDFSFYDDYIKGRIETEKKRLELGYQHK